MKTAEDVEDALTHLPQTLAELYSIIYDQIINSAGPSPILAQNVINWLLCAQRPLSSAQLTNAASTHLKQPASNEQVLDVCYNLVIFDADSDPLKFAHLSVREFFELLPIYETSKSNAYAAKHCLELLVQQLSINFTTPKQHAESRLFSKYAILYWASHYEKIDYQYRQGLLGDLVSGFFMKSKHDTQSPFEKWVEISHTYSKQLDYSDALRNKLDSVYACPPAPQFLVEAFGMLEVLDGITDLKYLDWSRTNASGELAVHLAASCGHTRLMVMLCESDSTICSAKDSKGRTPLTCAAINGRTEVARLFHGRGIPIDYPDDTDRTPLSHAAMRGHKDMCRFLLDQGAVVESRSDIQRTPLCYAARNGHVAVLQLLQAHGADVEALDYEDYTPLSWAADAGMVDTVEFLLDNGAQIDTEDKYGQTALARAAAAGREATVKVLLERNAGRDLRDKCGHTPLSRAAWHGQAGVAALLIERCVWINTQDDEGRTPLSWAAGNGHVPVVTLLLDAGADKKLVDLEGRTPLWWAEQNDHERIERLLSKAESSAHKRPPADTTLHLVRGTATLAL